MVSGCLDTNIKYVFYNRLICFIEALSRSEENVKHQSVVNNCKCDYIAWKTAKVFFPHFIQLLMQSNVNGRVKSRQKKTAPEFDQLDQH